MTANVKNFVSSNATKTAMENSIEELMREWTLLNLNLEIAIAEGARITSTTEERRIKEYSISTRNRRGFMMYTIRATLEDSKLTSSDMVKLLNCSKPAVNTMIQECKAENWIELIDGEKNKRYITAMPILIECYNGYTKWLFTIADRLNMTELSSTIRHLQRRIEK